MGTPCHFFDGMIIFFNIIEHLNRKKNKQTKCTKKKVGFNYEEHAALRVVNSIIFAGYIVLCCFTSYMENQRYVKDPYKTFMKYVKSPYFIVEIVSIIPWYHIVGAGGAYIPSLKLLRILRMVYWVKVFKKFDKLSAVSAFMLLLAVFVLAAHTLACLYHGVALSEGENSWIAKDNNWNADGLTRYVASYYWALMTISTIG